MEKGIIGRKVGMTQIFDEDGKVVPVTIIEAGPCVVTQKKTEEKDGYKAIQLGFSDTVEKRLTKPQKGHFDKAGAAYKKYLAEFGCENFDEVNVGDILKADVFAAGDVVDVTGTSKGKGYAGTVKRWNGAIMRRTHGTGPNHRHAGSNGSATDPSRVMPGKKLPGQLGNERVTIQNLDVVKVDAENNMLVVKGAIPGPKNGIVYIKSAVKA